MGAYRALWLCLINVDSRGRMVYLLTHLLLRVGDMEHNGGVRYHRNCALRFTEALELSRSAVRPGALDGILGY